MKGKLIDVLKDFLKGTGNYGRPQLAPVPVRVGSGRF